MFILRSHVLERGTELYQIEMIFFLLSFISTQIHQENVKITQ